MSAFRRRSKGSATWRRYRRPRRNSSDRRSISGLVSVRGARLIRALTAEEDGMGKLTGGKESRSTPDAVCLVPSRSLESGSECTLASGDCHSLETASLRTADMPDVSGLDFDENRLT